MACYFPFFHFAEELYSATERSFNHDSAALVSTFVLRVTPTGVLMSARRRSFMMGGLPSGPRRHQADAGSRADDACHAGRRGPLRPGRATSPSSLTAHIRPGSRAIHPAGTRCRRVVPFLGDGDPVRGKAPDGHGSSPPELLPAGWRERAPWSPGADWLLRHIWVLLGGRACDGGPLPSFGGSPGLADRAEEATYPRAVSPLVVPTARRRERRSGRPYGEVGQRQPSPHCRDGWRLQRERPCGATRRYRLATRL